MSPITRYFFAAFPDQAEREVVLARANELQQRLAIEGNRVLRHRLNMTVQFIGTFDGHRQDVEQCALDVGNKLWGLGSPLTFDSATRFAGSYGKDPQCQPALLYPSAVPQVWRDAAEQVRASFSWLPPNALGSLPPHVTILYTQDRQLDQPTSIAPFVWQPRELCLVRSTQGAGDYETLCGWTL